MTPRSVMNFVVAAFVWAVGSEQSEPGYHAVEAICTSCGSRIRDDWRLCPHCGELRSGSDSNLAPQR